jgi:hypothetical protein
MVASVEMKAMATTHAIVHQKCRASDVISVDSVNQILAEMVVFVRKVTIIQYAYVAVIKARHAR